MKNLHTLRYLLAGIALVSLFAAMMPVVLAADNPASAAAKKDLVLKGDAKCIALP